MAFTELANSQVLSDLIVYEGQPSVGYSRDVINVTPPAGGATVDLGTVVFRAKSADPLAAYAVLSASTDIDLDNEYAVVFGDEFGFNPSFVPKAVVTSPYQGGNAVSIKSGPVELKEYLIKQIAQDEDGAALTDAQFASLKEALAKQLIFVLDTVDNV